MLYACYRESQNISILATLDDWRIIDICNQ